MAEYTYRDPIGNLWVVSPAAPLHPTPQAGEGTWGWRVTIVWASGGVTTHQDPNLALALAEAVGKGRDSL